MYYGDLPKCVRNCGRKTANKGATSGGLQMTGPVVEITIGWLRDACRRHLIEVNRLAAKLLPDGDLKLPNADKRSTLYLIKELAMQSSMLLTCCTHLHEHIAAPQEGGEKHER